MRAYARILIGIAVILGPAAAQDKPSHSPRHAGGAAHLLVAKNPGCLCCEKWIEIAEAQGFTVEVVEPRDMAATKRTAGVPAAQASCHTTTAGGYFFEGHVPLDLVRQVLVARPAIAGLLAPGMPLSAPGMDDGRPHQPYDILVKGRDGKLSVYARR